VSTQQGTVFAFNPRWQQLQEQIEARAWEEVLATLEVRDRLLEYFLTMFTTPIGTIVAWGGATLAAIPNGWRVCDGSAVSRTAFNALFKVTGTTFGVGDGSTTFNLPDLRGRVPVGQLSGVTATLGAVGGNKDGALVQHNHGNTGTVSADHGHSFTTGGVSANHVHVNNFVISTAGGGIYAGGIGGSIIGFTPIENVDHAHSGSTGGISANHVHATADAGSAGTDVNLPPFQVIRYLIKV